jgi:hypothetical protein
VIATDVDRAFAHCRMTTYERMLWQYVREHSWGISARRGAPRGLWPDAIPCPLNLYALAKDWEVDRRRLVEAKGSLIEDRIFMDVDGLILINKDASTWPDSRLSPQGRAYAMDAWPKRVSEQTSPNEGGNPPRGEGGNPPRGRAEIRPGGGRKSAQGEGGNPPRVHVEEHARVLDSPRVEIPEDAPSERTQSESAGVRAPGPGDDLEPFEAPGLDLPPRIQPSGSDSAAARELEAWAGALGADRSGEPYAGWARAMCDLVPAAWVRRLLERRVLGRQGAGRASLPLCAKILADWQAAGQCEYETPAPAPAVNGHLPTPAVPRPESPSERRRRELKESLNAFKVPSPTEGESDAR